MLSVSLSDERDEHTTQLTGPAPSRDNDAPTQLHELRESVSTPSKCTVYDYRHERKVGASLLGAASPTPMSTRREAGCCRMRPR